MLLPESFYGQLQQGDGAVRKTLETQTEHVRNEHEPVYKNKKRAQLRTANPSHTGTTTDRDHHENRTRQTVPVSDDQTLFGCGYQQKNFFSGGMRKYAQKHVVSIVSFLFNIIHFFFIN